MVPVAPLPSAHHIHHVQNQNSNVNNVWHSYKKYDKLKKNENFKRNYGVIKNVYVYTFYADDKYIGKGRQ